MRLRLAGLIASRAAVDVLRRGARKPAHDRVLGALGDLVDRGEVALRGDREAGLDDVDAHGVEQLGDFELLLMRHGGAGTLLAVAQGGVEDDDAVLVGLVAGVVMENGPSRSSRRSRALYGFRHSEDPPECPGANAQPALRGG